MRTLQIFAVTVAISVISSSGAFAQSRTVAITVDDAPYAGGPYPHDEYIRNSGRAKSDNAKLLHAFQAHQVPVTAFVVQGNVELLGPDGTAILKNWIKHGFDLGNHTYSHPDINNLSIDQIEDEIMRGESGIAPLMQEAGRTTRFFRFPMDHTGDTKAKHDALAAFLAQHGYRSALCTIDSSDYIFNSAYVKMLAKKDAPSQERLRHDYLAYTSVEIDYYAGLNKQVFGYEPPEVMVLHDNRLNADLIDQVLAIFEQKSYKFVSLDAAQSDPAYQTADTDVTRFGPMWGYRWARERGVKVNGSLETEPPKWISDYATPFSQDSE